MGNTVFRALVTREPNPLGRIFFESFEGNNWQADQGWTVLNGTPANSNAQFFDGLKSFIVDSSFPLIQKSFTTAYTYAVAYFHDTATATATKNAWVLFGDAAGTPNFYGVGVDNSISTTNYVNFATGLATAIARSTGWHRITFEVTGGTYVVKVDGVIAISAATAGFPFQKLKFGSTDTTGTAPINFVDYIQVSLRKEINVYGLEAGMLLKIFTEAGVQIGTTGTASGVPVTAGVSLALQDSPFNGYIRVLKPGGKDLYFHSPVRELFAGESYTVLNLDFGRRAGMVDAKPMVKRDDKESVSGKTEDLFYSEKDDVKMAFAELTHDERQALNAWWSFAQRGENYSVALDSANIAFSKLVVATPSGGTAFQVDDVAGFGVGQGVFVKRSTNEFYEWGRVISVMAPYVEIDREIVNPYQVGDILVAEMYWPSVVSTDKILNTSLTNLKAKRWAFTHAFKEDL